MTNRLRSWFTSFSSTDESQREDVAFLLRATLLVSLALSLVAILAALIFRAASWERLIRDGLIGLGVSLGLWLVLRRYSVRLAALGTVLAFTVTATFTGFTGIGVRGTSYPLFILIVMGAALLIHRRAGYPMALVSSLIGLAMVWANQAGLMPNANRPLAEPAVWLIVSMFCFIAAVMLNIALRQRDRALEQARRELAERTRAEDEVRRLNAELEQRIAERTAQLAASEERYRLISSVSSDYMFSTRLNDQGELALNWVAGAFEAMTGYAPEEYAARGGWRAVLHPDDLAADDRDLGKLRANQRVVSEVRTITKSGEARWVRVYAHPVWDAERQQLIGIYGAVHDINAQKQAEQALLHERDLLQALMNHLPDSIYFKDTASRLIRVNQGFARVLNLADPEAAIGLTDFDLQAPQLAQAFFDEEQAMLQSGQSIVDRIEFNPAPDDQPRWLSATKAPMRDRAGQIIGLVGISRDVTERELARQMLTKQANEMATVARVSAAASTLLDSDELLQTVADLTKESFGLYHAHIYLLSADGQTLVISAGAGEAGRQIRAQGWHIALNHPHSIVAQVARSRQGALVNTVQQSPDFLSNPFLPHTQAEIAVPLAVGGQLLGVFDVQSEASAGFGEADVQVYTALAHQLAVALQNARRYELAQKEIGERQKAEALVQRRADEFETLYQTAQVLSQQNDLAALLDIIAERAKTLLKAENGFVFLYDAVADELEYRVSRVIPARGQRMRLGEGMAGRVAQTRQPLMVDDYHTWSGRVATYEDWPIAANLGVPMLYNGALVGVLGVENFSPNLSKFVAADARLLTLFAAQAAAAVSNTRSVEQIRRNAAELEERVAERTAQLEAALRELEATSYTISHDLRSPLRAINGFARILLDDYAAQLPPQAQQHLHRVRNGAQRMGQLIDDLLAFFRLNRQGVTRQWLAPAALAREALGALAREQAGRPVDVVIGDLPECQADPALLKQVFLQLLGNALKFTRQRQPARIEIGSERRGDETVYFVRDNGVGFDMQYVHKLFGIFQRLHGMEDFEGTGVGLAIVQRILHRHGGRIWAEAEPDKGATFYFTLPASRPATSA